MISTMPASETLNSISQSLGIDGLSLELYMGIVAVGLISLFVLPYLIARLNGAAHAGARSIGLKGLIGGLLVAGGLTAPIGLFFVGKAFWTAYSPQPA